MKTRKLLSALALMLALTLPVMGLAAEEYGAAAVEEGETYTLEQMLTYAIQDEYLARVEYSIIIEKLGVDRPFTNIVKAEGVHVQYLLPLFEAYSVPVPVDTAAGLVILPATLEEIYQANVTAEVRNIAMYETFLKQDGLPEDVEDVFEALKRASENHLTAFQRNLDKPGIGQASRVGNRWTDGSAAGNGGKWNQPGDGCIRNGRGRGRRGN